MVPLEFLTTDELDKLKKFMEITNIEEDETAHTLLVDSNWNLEVALETFWLIGPESSAPAIGSTGFQLDPIEQSHSLVAGSNGEDIGIGNNQNDEFVGEAEGEGTSGASAVEMEPLMPIHNQSVPDALTTFTDNFERRYCSESNLASFMPMFFTNTLDEAIDVAFNSQEGKPLLFFFNHEQGKNKRHFIEERLCNDYISDLLRNNFVLFPWDVTESANMQRMLQMLLGANMKCVYDRLLHFYSRRLEDFPLMVVVSRQRAYEVIGTITGSTGLNEMCQIFHESFQQFRSDHADRLQEEMKRKHDRELFDKQNLEYEQSLMADLRRKQEKQLLEKETISKNERLLKEAKKKEEEDNHRAQMAARKVPKEPQESDAEIVTIKFRLPGSKQDTRLFYKTDKVRSLIDYLESKKYFSDQYTFLNSDIPKQDITEFFDCEKTFAEVNWPNKEIVFVNPSD